MKLILFIGAFGKVRLARKLKDLDSSATSTDTEENSKDNHSKMMRKIVST
jgi:hypothetical protein